MLLKSTITLNKSTKKPKYRSFSLRFFKQQVSAVFPRLDYYNTLSSLGMYFIFIKLILLNCSQGILEMITFYIIIKRSCSSLMLFCLYLHTFYRMPKLPIYIYYVNQFSKIIIVFVSLIVSKYMMHIYMYIYIYYLKILFLVYFFRILFSNFIIDNVNYRLKKIYNK